jgi:hypothetical protein
LSTIFPRFDPRNCDWEEARTTWCQNWFPNQIKLVVKVKKKIDSKIILPLVLVQNSNRILHWSYKKRIRILLDWSQKFLLLDDDFQYLVIIPRTNKPKILSFIYFIFKYHSFFDNLMIKLTHLSRDWDWDLVQSLTCD